MMHHRHNGSTSYALTPHKVSLCFLLFEAYQSPLLSLTKQNLLLGLINSHLEVGT